MKKTLLPLVGAIIIAGCCSAHRPNPAAVAVSPDGRNEIRLYVNPLAYEVRRDGVTVADYSEIGLKVNGQCLAQTVERAPKVSSVRVDGTEKTPFYKKDEIDLTRNDTLVDFGKWAVRLTARDDGVAYRFETKFPKKIKVDCEKASLVLPEKSARAWANFTGGVGQEESTEVHGPAVQLKTEETKDKDWAGKKMIYLPFAYTAGGKYVTVTESDVLDYPIWNLQRDDVKAVGCAGGAKFGSFFARWPKKTFRAEGWGKAFRELPSGGRWVWVDETEDYLVETAGKRTFPWRTFILADRPAQVCEADIVRALARSADPKADFSWVKPGKVAWDWWNDWNLDEIAATLPFKPGCNTKTYEYYIDFASRHGVEYVIFDEGWSEALNIWKFHPNVDVPHLIKYAAERKVGIILWLAWAQAYQVEAKVVDHFADMGVKGFKVDFMDRGDAEVARFLDTFAAECARRKLVVDYHGVYRPTGMERRYPNILNYEGIHGLEQMKFYKGLDMMGHDVAAFYLRLAAGPMDYTPGAMLNFPVGQYTGTGHNPGSMGTRCRQMAMMALYNAPLQMLCDSPAKYEKNLECFKFMAATPVVWAKTVGLPGCPDSCAAVARQAQDGAWYAAVISNAEARGYELSTDFLGEGEWQAEVFYDDPNADVEPMKYVHKTLTVKAGSKLGYRLAQGGGLVVRFTKK